MKDKELRRLSKVQLLTMLRDQELEIQALKKKNAILRKNLMDKNIRIQESGSIAEAALKLTAIFEEAQKAVDLYKENCMNKQPGSVLEETVGGTDSEQREDLR
jgi:hypothetical protein